MVPPTNEATMPTGPRIGSIVGYNTMLAVKAKHFKAPEKKTEPKAAPDEKAPAN